MDSISGGNIRGNQLAQLDVQDVEYLYLMRAALVVLRVH
jgi:hypothetical protein